MAMKPPKHLSAESKKWWNKIEEGWKLTPDSYILLKVALEAYDEVQQARETIKRHGGVVKYPSGIVRVNPAHMILKVARQNFLQAWKMLNFGIEPPGEIGRPAIGGFKTDADD